MERKMQDIVRKRHIKLKGVQNLRDLGGYSTPNGKKTKWKTIYRSDNLDKITKRDIPDFKKLGIRLIIDLRAEDEQSQKINKDMIFNKSRIKNIPIRNSYKKHSDLKRELFYGKLSDANLKEELIKIYQKAILNYKSELMLILNLLLDPNNYPVLINCNTGKDRTGVVCAIILLAVGVSRQTILEDYMLSKKYLDPMIKRLVFKVRLMSLFRANVIQIKNILDTNPEYLNATFKTIDNEFGTAESCLKYLGIDGKKKNKLVNLICETNIDGPEE